MGESSAKELHSRRVAIESRLDAANASQEMDALKLALTILDASRQPVGQNIAIWLSTDARKLPVKLQAQLPVGDFVLALKDAK